MNLEQKIDRYLSGQLSASESVQFEKEMAADEVIQQEVHMQQQVLLALRMKGEMNVKSMLQKHESTKGSLFSRGRLLALVMIMIGCLVLFYFFKKPQPETEEVLMAQYFEPYKSPSVLRGNEENINAWSRGAQAYTDGDYLLAAQELALISSDSVAPLYLVNFYRANALLASDADESSTAIKLLSELIQGQHDYVQQSKWYLALAYIQSGMKSEGTLLLNEIVDQKLYKHVEAQQLLDKL